MAKGQVVGPEVENLIASVYRQHHGKWKAPKVRDEVEGLLLDKAVKEGKSKPPEGFPSLSKVQKFLAILRRPGTTEDEPWSISTLNDEHPIPPEALPVVLDVSMSSQQTLTIREAKWIGRLYNLLSTIISQQKIDKVSVEWIKGIATFYATSERISEITGKKPAPAMDEILWKFLTKRESMAEVAKRGFDPGNDDDRFRKGEDGRLYYGVTKKKLASLKKMKRGIDSSTPFDNFATLGLTLDVKESENERTSG